MDDQKEEKTENISYIRIVMSWFVGLEKQDSNLSLIRI